MKKIYIAIMLKEVVECGQNRKCSNWVAMDSEKFKQIVQQYNLFYKSVLFFWEGENV